MHRGHGLNASWAAVLKRLRRLPPPPPPPPAPAAPRLRFACETRGSNALRVSWTYSQGEEADWQVKVEGEDDDERGAAPDLFDLQVSELVDAVYSAFT